MEEEKKYKNELEEKSEKEMPEELKDFIKNSHWIFAKTYAAFAPHYYTIKEWKTKELFEKLVIFMRKNGVVRKWHQRIGIYLDYDGYSYWTMGNSLENTTGINRKIIDYNDKNSELPRNVLVESKLPYIEEVKTPQQKLLL